MKNLKILIPALIIMLLSVENVLKAETEPNNSFQEANLINLNTEYVGYLDNSDVRDWYKIQVTVDGRLIIGDTTSATLDYFVRLYEGDGTTVIKQERRYKDNSGVRIGISLTPGYYYVEFNRYSSDAIGTYTFTPQFIAVARPGDAEPNDSFELAEEVDINVSNSGNLGFRKTGIYDNIDWYKFTITGDGRLTIRDTTVSTLEYFLALYEEDGTTLIKELRRFKDNSGEILSVSLVPGTYYLRFTKYGSDFSTFGEYTFIQQFIEVSRPGDTEPNDSFELAEEVDINASNSGNLGFRKTGIYDNIDWYKFIIPADGRLIISDTTTSTLEYMLALYEANGTTKLREIRRYKDNSGTPIAINLLPGTYYIKFEKYGSNYSTYGQYSFTLNFTEVTKPGDSEPNDSLQNAVEVSLDSLHTGNLGHRKTGMYDNIDWYAITLPGDGLLTLLDTTVSTLEYFISLYKEDGTTLIKELRRFSDNSGSALSVNLGAGTYYLKFSKYGTDYSVYGSYSFYPDFLPKPEAAFTYIQNISSVSFTNNSVNGESYQWNFDDEGTSIEVNPGHDFNEPGEYNVSLIAKNQAGSDTVSQYVTIFGFKSIIDNVGGNTGDVSIDIYGGGFTQESTVKFTREGFDDIIPDTVLYLRKGVLTALFNLRGAATGVWDVEVETNENNIIVEKGGFTIEEGLAPEPWVEITGRTQALLGRWQTYTINYGNKGNVDASGVPLWLVVSENPDTEIQFVDFEIVPPQYAVDSLGLERILRDSISVYFVTDTLFGEPFNARVYPLIIPVIPAGQTGQFTVKVKSMQNFRLMAWVNPPMFESPMNQQIKDCIFWAQMKAIGDGIVSVAGMSIPLVGCINSIVTNYIYNPWSYDKPTDNDPKSMGSHMWTLASTIINCAGDIPIFKVYQITVAVLQFGASVIDNSIADKECREAFANESKTNMNVRTVTSFDPNEKAGPEGYTGNNYINRPSFMDYTIYFENKDTAKAPAQEILISDSLDTDIFDITKINFKSVTIADTTVNILAGLKEFAVDIDMKPEMDIIVRATGKIDTISGVISWFFKALDPVTMDDNEDPELGVLLPNNISPRGEGNVTFNVGLKPEIGNDDIIKNNAVITFDFNEAIITNEYFNIIDSEKPQSNILPLASQSNETISLEIQGFDNGSGIDHYTVFASVDDSGYVPVIKTLTKQVNYVPEKGNNFKFYTVATDKAGNTEEHPIGYDAETNLVSSTNSLRTRLSIEVWPNPVTDDLTINSNDFSGKEVYIELKTILGQSLLTDSMDTYNGTQFTLDLSELIQGIYILQIKCGDAEYFERIIKY